MEIYKNPQLYKSLGELAVALGGKNSFGAKAGMYGQQESEEWAAREAQKRAEQEAKKKKNAGIGGSIGSTIGGIGGFMVGGPAGAAAGAALGSGAGQGIGGGGTDYIDMGKVATDAALSGVTSFGAQALAPATATAQGAAQGGTEAALSGAVPPLVDGASAGGVAGAARAADFAAATGNAVTNTTSLAPVAAAGAPIVDAVPAGSVAPKALEPANVFTKMGFSPQNAAAGQSFVDASGGWQGVVQPLVNAASAPLDVADSLEPYPGLSSAGLSQLRQDARAGEQLHAQRANMALDNQVAQQRLSLDKQQMAISEKRAEAALNEPVAVKQVDPATGIETTQYVPKSALTSAQPLITGAPKPQGMINVAPGSAVYDPKTQSKVFENPKAPADPKFHALSEGQILTDEQGNIVARGNAKTQKPVLVDVFDNINGSVVQRKEVWMPGQPVPQGTASLNDIAKAKSTGSGSGGPQTAPSYNNLQTDQYKAFVSIMQPWATFDPMTNSFVYKDIKDVGVAKQAEARARAEMLRMYNKTNSIAIPYPEQLPDGRQEIKFIMADGSYGSVDPPIILPKVPDLNADSGGAE